MPGHLTVLRGLPGSGKSTSARQRVAEDPTSRVIVSRDGFRTMLRGDGTRPHGVHEDEVTAMSHHAVRTLLGADKHVYVDDTNLPHRRVREWFGLAEQCAATWDVCDFTNLNLDTVLRQNAQREHAVPEDVIRRMHQKFVAGGAKTPEQWEPVGSNHDTVTGAPYVPDESLPPAIIVDIDGTLAKMNGRSPYDYTRVGEDLPNTPVLEYMHAIADNTGAAVIFVSGRPEQCRAETEDWLSKHVWHFTKLYMRSDAEHEDRVRDDKVKLRLFNEHIRHNYNVHSVLDDRSRVVQMWRSLGLTVLQVAEGNF
ncbi:phosphatase domain-containing protein [Nesterenkonia flava]|uniref:AAA family ATPase n=1 Tax=Nesterenkonia flava TaxID=469799 RepID=A0ABU1FS25_9MICC|nr:AAA family ATPase [Nesterenkonia flava]MDR5711424.1 AAA family ATPase [Nesterenkonia flava]